MPKFKPYNSSQAMLLPPLLSDCLPSDHIAFLIDEVVENLDLSAVEAGYADKGCPAYNPRAMIKILFYGHTQKVTSSRQLEKNNYENNAFRFLSGNQQPDHGTISLFRKIHLSALESIFAQIVVLANRLDMVDLSDISIDGSKFKACASKKKHFNQEQIDKIREKISQELKEAVDLDEAEDEKFGSRRGYNQLPPELSDPEKRKKAIAEAKRKLEKLQDAEKRIKEKQANAPNSDERKAMKNAASNLTDPDASLMKMKDSSYKIAYNIQLATSNQIITGYSVSSEPSDAGHLQNMIETSEKNSNTKVKITKADAGYFSKDDLEYCQNKNIDAYIPDHLKEKEEKQEKENNIPKYNRRNFKYDEKNDRFICPQGKFLAFAMKGGQKKGRKYLGESCADCPVKKECTKGKCRYLFYDQDLERLRQEMRAKLNTEEGKLIYQKRMYDTEPVYGNMKRNLGFTEFRTRGKPTVLIETGLYATAHNLVKIFKNVTKRRKKQEDIQLNTLMRLPAGA